MKKISKQKRPRGRPPGRAFPEVISVPLADDMVEEIERVLKHEPSQTRLDFIREAIARELKRRRRGKD
jgi:metal-responsive CopG/Arc/MetJ family transcriptional regulator